MGVRLLLAARKSRKVAGADADYERQDHQVREWAEAQGHVIVHATADTVSSQTAPWKRRELGPWMTDPAKLALYDAILISDTDRISRGTAKDFHYLEHWAYEHGKSIIVAKRAGRKVFYFPARDGNDIDKDRWDDSKDAARDEWEAIRDRHADAREVIYANRVKSGGTEGVDGMPPFGYVTSGPKYRKTFVPHPVNAALAREAFRRIADGQSGARVALWLTGATGRNAVPGKKYDRTGPVRVKFICDMIRNRTYLGERDGVTFEPLISRELFESANAVLAGRSFTRSANASDNGYSGCVFCATCGAQLYFHQSTRNGKATGAAKYRCGRGRRGLVTEAKCTMPGLPVATVDAAVSVVMASLKIDEQVQRSAGGDASKKADLAAIDRAMKAALAKHDMGEVTRLAAAYAAREAREAAPVTVWWEPTGRVLGDVWRDGDLAQRRELLTAGIGTHELAVVINPDGMAELADIVSAPDVRAVA